ncbi:MAG: shikimate kinase [Pseudomonadota bacterium]
MLRVMNSEELSSLTRPIRRSIVLVGMMGVGKSTVGRRLAPALGLPFFDADEEIEKAAGMTVGDLFVAHGETHFREGEAKVIKRLLSGPPIVLASGGGAMNNGDTRCLVRQNATGIWLRADLDTLVQRATRRNTRPLLREGDPRETLERLLKEREPYYAEAPITIESQPGSHLNTVQAILSALNDYLEATETNCD